jgi:hypothetical protein
VIEDNVRDLMRQAAALAGPGVCRISDNEMTASISNGNCRPTISVISHEALADAGIQISQIIRGDYSNPK